MLVCHIGRPRLTRLPRQRFPVKIGQNDYKGKLSKYLGMNWTNAICLELFGNFPGFHIIRNGDINYLESCL